MAKAYEYEVRCPRCDVSFPKDTKKCIHCGGPTGASHRPGNRMQAGFSSDPFDPTTPEAGTRAATGFLRPRPLDHEPEEEEEVSRGGLLRAAITVVWILLAVGFSVVRACSEN